ncbi:MAG: PepSY domain-containing protein [Permianibacter sp.]
MSKSRKNTMRNWHNWISVALGVPLLLVGLTTVFIAHEKRLGTKSIEVPIASPVEEIEIRASAAVGSENWLGTKYGVFRLNGADAVPVGGTPVDEIRDLLVHNETLLLAGKKGIWRYADGQSSQLYQGDCWQLTSTTDGLRAACKDAGLLHSTDGTQWQMQAVQFPADLQITSTTTPLSKIIMDMHTGKFFLGKEYEWIWIDLLGFACVALGLTGLVMWMRGRRQRAAM